MKKFKFASAALAAILSFGAVFAGGCINGTDGADGKDGANGKDGQDVSIYEIFEAVNDEREKQGLEELDFLEFVSEYLNYSSDEMEDITSVQNTINRSMLSAVTVLSRFSYQDSSSGGIFPGFGGSSSIYYGVGTGSGVIIDLDKQSGDAIIVTNCHVIYDDTSREVYSDDIRLYLYGQDIYGINYNVSQTTLEIKDDEKYKIPATIIGASVAYDIAVLKVENSEVLKNSDAIEAAFCEDETVHVGETVFAIGNGAAEGIAATQGIISRDSQEIALSLSSDSYSSDYEYYRVLRTDAAINGGNSGGGLFNTKGEVVAIVNAKSVEEGVDNMGYALPASTVKRVVQNIIDNADAMEDYGVKRAMLGIVYKRNYTYAEYNTQTNMVEIFEEVAVQSVESGIAADSGQIRVGDVIKHVAVGTGGSSSFVAREEISVTRAYNVTDVLISVRQGDTVKLTLERSGQQITVYLVYDSSKYFTVK